MTGVGHLAASLAQVGGALVNGPVTWSLAAGAGAAEAAPAGLGAALLDGLAAVCLLLGAFLAFSAGVGVLRFGHLLARMHAVTKPQVLGLVLLMTGVALRLRSGPALAVLALVVAFQLLTSPVAAHMVGRAGFRTGKVRPEDLEVDDLTAAGPEDDSAQDQDQDRDRGQDEDEDQDQDEAPSPK